MLNRITSDMADASRYRTLRSQGWDYNPHLRDRVRRPVVGPNMRACRRCGTSVGVTAKECPFCHRKMRGEDEGR